MKRKENITTVAPIVILVRPQLSQNIGMVARSMMNCGLSELRLVGPKQSHLSDEAVSASSGAQMILEQAEIFNSLEDALADIHYSFATTARTRDMVKPVVDPKTASLKTNSFLKKDKKVAFVFGPERTGLENEDVVLANAIISIDLNPVHPSLNLAQAVLLVGWSWWQNKNQLQKGIKISSIASQTELNKFLIFFEKELEESGYFQWPEKRLRMINNMRNIFVRNELTSSEIKTLYRMVKKLTERKK